MKQSLRIAMCLAAFALSACGGGSGAPPAPSNAPPSLTVTSPSYAGTTDRTEFIFRGSVSDPDGDPIASLRFRDASGALLLSVAVPDSQWSHAVPLAPGRNTISVEAVDARSGTDVVTVALTRDLFLQTVVSPIHDASAGTVFLLSASFNNFAPLAVVGVDLATGTRTIVSGDGTGAGPALDRTDLMIRDPISGDLLVFNGFPRNVLRVDPQSGDRTFLGNADAVGDIRGAVVDSSSNRVLMINSSYELWQMSLTGVLSQLGSIAVPSGDAAPRQGLAVSSNGTLVYVHAGAVIAEVDMTQSLAVRELLLDSVVDSTTDLLLDEAGNRLLYSHRQEIVGVDLASGINTLLVTLADDVATPSYMARGRAADEVLIVDEFRDQLAAVSLMSGSTERLAGSLIGAGPAPDQKEIAFDSASGAIYSSIRVPGATPQDDTWSLLRIDPTSGDRSIVQTEFGEPQVFVNNTGMGVDSAGNVLWSTTALPDGLWQFDPATGLGARVVPYGPGLTGSTQFCYDATTNVAYLLRATAGEVAALDVASGVGLTLSSAAAVGSGPWPVSVLGLSCDSANARVLLTDTDSASTGVVAVDATTGDRTLISSSRRGEGELFLLPDVLAVSPDGNTAYVSDLGAGRLYAVDMASGDRTVAFERRYGPIGFQALSMAMIDNESAFVTDQFYKLWLLDLTSGEGLLLSN